MTSPGQNCSPSLSLTFFIWKLIFHWFKNSLNKCLLFALSYAWNTVGSQSNSNQQNLLRNWLVNTKESARSPLVHCCHKARRPSTVSFLLCFLLDIHVLGTSTTQLERRSLVLSRMPWTVAFICLPRARAERETRRLPALAANWCPKLLTGLRFRTGTTFSFWFVTLTFRLGDKGALPSLPLGSGETLKLLISSAHIYVFSRV